MQNRMSNYVTNRDIESLSIKENKTNKNLKNTYRRATI